MSPLTVTITSHGSRPLTVNKERRMNLFTSAAHTKATREEFCLRALAECRSRSIPSERAVGKPMFSTAVIDVTPLHRDARSPQDPGACYIELKAALDGIVDAGLLAGDDGRYVKRLSFYPPSVCGVDGLRIVLTEATDG